MTESVNSDSEIVLSFLKKRSSGLFALPGIVKQKCHTFDGSRFINVENVLLSISK